MSPALREAPRPVHHGESVLVADRGDHRLTVHELRGDAIGAGEVRRQTRSGSVQRGACFIEHRGETLEDVGHLSATEELPRRRVGDGGSRAGRNIHVHQFASVPSKSIVV